MPEPLPALDAMGAGKALGAAYALAGVPVHMHLDVTYRCDLACKHCYLDDRETWPELTTDEWFGVLDQLAAAGVWSLVWSGGDVGVRSDFRQLIEHARGLGFLQRVKTHAGWIGPQEAAWLVGAGVHQVDVSIYSLQDAVHDAFVQRPRALQRSLQGIDALRAAGATVKISCSVQPALLPDLEAFLRHFAALGCEVTCQTLMYRDQAGGAAQDALQLTPEQVLYVKRLVRKVFRPERQPFRPPIAQQPGSVPCSAGRTRGYIAPDGAVWPCVMWPMALGHLREQPFAQIWADSPARAEIVAWTNASRTSCQSCAGSGSCFYCAGHAWKTTGDFRTAAPDFHAHTRVNMLLAQELGEATFTDDDWASVPDVEPVRPPVVDQPQKMYRPSRGRGVRVQQVALSQTKIGQS